MSTLKPMLGLPEDATDDDVYAAVDRLIAERDRDRMQIDGLNMAAQVYAHDSESEEEGDVSTLMRELSTPPRHPHAIPIALRQVKRLRALAVKVAPLEREVSTLRAEAAALRARNAHLEAAERRAATTQFDRDALVLALRHARRALRFGLGAGDADVLAVAATSARKGIKRTLARFAPE